MVDDDINPANINDVIWAMCTRCDVREDVEIIRGGWSSALDPMCYDGETDRRNARVVIDACRPFARRETRSQSSRARARSSMRACAPSGAPTCRWDFDRPLAAVQVVRPEESNPLPAQAGSGAPGSVRGVGSAEKFIASAAAARPPCAAPFNTYVSVSGSLPCGGWPRVGLIERPRRSLRATRRGCTDCPRGCVP